MSTPLWVKRQICVPSLASVIGVTLTSAAGRLVPSISSVAGLMYGYSVTFCAPGVGGCASTPRLACMRPYSSNVEEFISSWIAFGSSAIVIFAVGALRVLKPNVAGVVDAHETVALGDVVPS